MDDDLRINSVVPLRMPCDTRTKPARRDTESDQADGELLCRRQPLRQKDSINLR